MTLIAAFTIPGEPVSKERARVTAHGSYTPKKTLLAEKNVRDCFTTQCVSPTIFATNKDAAFGLRVELFLGTRRRRDIDNMVKLIQDALNGLAYVDDSQIVRLEASKAFVTKDEARTEVFLRTVSAA